MNLFKKLFKSYKESSEEKEIKEQPVYLSLDDSFVHHFIDKGGKFLYCTNIKEVVSNLQSIVKENEWKKIACSDFDLIKLADKSNVLIKEELGSDLPIFTSCEHLIASKGDVLFSSNQIEGHKLASLSKDFIVYATTSQLVKNTSEGLTGIRINYKGNIPTNISSVTNYEQNKDKDNYMNYGNTNSKNLYLLLFEDL